MELIRFAACDLDKTLYPPPGPEHYSQLVANVDAMCKFEESGGMVFPVTGNNLQMAQQKFMDPRQNKKMLRDVRKNPGIFTNGALVLGAEGKILEKHSLGNLICKQGKRNDFITQLLDFFDEHQHKPIIEDVGLLVSCSDLLVGYKNAYSHSEAFAQHMRIPPASWSREDILQHRKDVLQVIILFPELKSADSRTQCQEYLQVIRPRQEELQRAFRSYGLLDCAYEEETISGVGAGINLILMKDPWPSLDINVAGVNKGTALKRFLKNTAVINSLIRPTFPTAETVAVFGDAANDVPMFEEVNGFKPLWRVAMPHATDPDLLLACNVRAQVGETLMRFVDAMGNHSARIRSTMVSDKINTSARCLLNENPLKDRLVICIVGSTSFQDPSSEALVEEISKLITAQKSTGSRADVAFVTCGMAGVQKVFAENSHNGSMIFNLVPQGSQSTFLKGVDIIAGCDEEERRNIFGQIGNVYLTFEGGPGVAEDAKAASAHSALILPIQRTGGASSWMFSFPQSALSKLWCATEQEWRLLAEKNASIAETALACCEILQKFLSQRQVRRKKLEFDLHQFSCQHPASCKLEVLLRHVHTFPQTTVQVLLLCRHIAPQQFIIGAEPVEARITPGGSVIDNYFQLETCSRHRSSLCLTVKGKLPGTLSIQATFQACDGSKSIFAGSLHTFTRKPQEY